MNRYILTVFFILLGQASSASIDLIKVTDQFINKNIKTIKSPGSIIAVIKDGKIIHYKTFGKRNIEDNLSVEKQTLFRIGSLTKTFTATAIMILQEKGLLKLDSPIENYITELKNIKYPYPNSPLITIRHLVTHTSGLIRHPQPADQSIEGLIEMVLHPNNKSTFISDDRPKFWYPGYHYSYSNLAVALLGEIVTRVSKLPIQDFIKQEILNPLAMNNTYWHESELPQNLRSYSYDLNNKIWEKRKDWDLKGYSAAGSIYSNIDDLAKWMNLQFQSSPENNPVILNPFIINRMHTIQVTKTPTSTGGTGIIWYNTTTKGYNQIGHGGATGGYKAHFSFDKKNKIGVIVLAANGSARVGNFGENLLAKIQEKIKKEITDESLRRFRPIVQKLLPYLQLKVTSNFLNIFDKNILDSIGSDEKFAAILVNIQKDYGRVEEILSIKPSSKRKAKLTLKTSKGTIIYDLTLSKIELKKLSGLFISSYKQRKN